MSYYSVLKLLPNFLKIEKSAYKVAANKIKTKPIISQTSKLY